MRLTPTRKNWDMAGTIWATLKLRKYARGSRPLSLLAFAFPISLGLTQIFKRRDATSAQTSLKLNTSPLFFIGQMRQTKGAR